MASKSLQLIVGALDKTKVGLMTASAKIKAFGHSVGGVASKIAAGFAIAAAAVIAGVVAIGYAFKKGIVEAVTYGDSFGKMARRLGADIKELQRISFALDLSGVENPAKNLEKGMLKMFNFIEDLKDELSTAVIAADKLGISLGDLKGKTPTQQLDMFTIALSGFEDAQTRAALASDVFGSKIGPKLIPYLEGGAKGIADLKKEADKLGFVLSEKDIKKAEELSDSFLRLKTIFKAMRIEFSSRFFVVLNNIITSFVNWIAILKDTGVISAWGDKFVQVLALIQPKIEKVQGLITAIFTGSESARAQAIKEFEGFGEQLGLAIEDGLIKSIAGLIWRLPLIIGKLLKAVAVTLPIEMGSQFEEWAESMTKESRDRREYNKNGPFDSKGKIKDLGFERDKFSLGTNPIQSLNTNASYPTSLLNNTDMNSRLETIITQNETRNNIDKEKLKNYKAK